MNEKVGASIRWLALIMVLVGAFNSIARWATRYIGVSLSSNALLDAQWYLFSLIFLLGAAYGLNRDFHVRVDVLYGRLSNRGKALIDLLGTALFLLPFSALMLWVSWSPIRESWRIREVSPDPGGLARYPIKAVILVCFFLLLLQGVSQVIKTAHTLQTGEAPPGDSPSAGEDSSGLEPGTPEGAAS